jgi:hypothetical protein
MTKSIVAVVLGLVVVVVLSNGTDQVLHATGVFPPSGQRMADGLFALALGYRVVAQVLGAWLTARFAPRNPMKHAWVLGFIGLVLSIAGAVASIITDLGPVWYAVALAVSALPTAWLGGVIYVRRAARS